MSKNFDWYSIDAKAGSRSAKVTIYDQIGENFWGEGVSARQFVKEIDALDVDEIDLHINSPGGNVFEGNTIYNALRQHKATVKVTIDGIAASIASVIAMAGESVHMPETSMMMIHDPSALVIGNSSDMRKTADALDKVKGGIVAAYMTRVKGEDRLEIERMMTDETWLTPQEAVNLGLATEVMDGIKAQACAFDMLNQFKRVPRRIFENSSNSMQKEQPMKITLETIKAEHPEIADALRDEGRKEAQAEAKAEGATAERERIQAVLAQSMPGHDDLIEKLAFDGKTTGPEAAVQVLQAEKQVRTTAAENLKADAPKPVKQPPTEDFEAKKVDDDESLPIDERAKLKWDGDKKIQAEFGGDFDSFKAYFEAMQSGRARVIRGKDGK